MARPRWRPHPGSLGMLSEQEAGTLYNCMEPTATTSAYVIRHEFLKMYTATTFVSRCFCCLHINTFPYPLQVLKVRSILLVSPHLLEQPQEPCRKDILINLVSTSTGLRFLISHLVLTAPFGRPKQQLTGKHGL